MEANDFLKLCGNIVDRKGQNNIKIFNIISKGFELYDKHFEKVLFSDVIDKLLEKELDLFGSQFKIYRSGRTDEEYRKFLKLSFLLRLGRVDFNFIVNAISIFFNIEKHRIQIFDYNSDKNIKVRHIKLRILKKANIREIILFLKSIKAAGIIIDCWEMLDGEFLINCKGEKQKYIVKSDVRYEYDRHEYNLDEMLELND
ncbi:hypothetical protein HMPREF1984_00087 [Leptotrichia sp. oral taxon 215 str. W9775]|jgi:hypothetical protein|uniref:hypothetical protein n=1 Tax=Leptotrichia sp. oral taxon 215 TaxID=712359 RepID=UPI0003AE6D4B|nr:hypothetical protein [Leptotrichia sp. oral taxon 215]ERK69036.1 hypothetical protein HMPREF1984_00087 [Leptotrichia sp. oral taxon 215 str. W9775]DAX44513.1 MAG TPA: Protein of unknown function (DUF2612) [Caudoviricetes sp.]